MGLLTKGEPFEWSLIHEYRDVVKRRGIKGLKNLEHNQKKVCKVFFRLTGLKINFKIRFIIISRGLTRTTTKISRDLVTITSTLIIITIYSIIIIEIIESRIIMKRTFIKISLKVVTNSNISIFLKERTIII